MRPLFQLPLRWLINVLLLVSISACSTLSGPEYKRPELPQKEGWSNLTREQLSARKVIRADWWTGFGDTYLDQLVSKAIAGNIDLRIMAGRMKRAGTAVSAEKAGLLPRSGGTTGADFSSSHSGSSQNFSLGASLSWELDIWGKLQKGVAATKAEYKANEAEWRAGYLRLVSDVSSRYFEIRQLDEQTARKQKSLKQNHQILTIYQQQLAEGLLAHTKVMKQKAEIDGTEKDILDFQRQRTIAVNNLATLLGVPAGEFTVPQASLRDRVNILEVPAGLPSDLLSRRPDLIAAEYRVLQSHHLLGKARLAKLPTISMTAQGGLANQVLSQVLKSWTLGIGPTISIPIFDPTLSAQINSAEVDAEITKDEYRNQVIKAFEEVENALVNLSSRKQQKQKLEQQGKRLAVIRQQVLARLKEGLVSQLEVLEAERSLVSVELALLNIYQQILSDTIILYKALGGGWPNEKVG